MGADFSTCCGGEGGKEAQIDFPPPDGGGAVVNARRGSAGGGGVSARRDSISQKAAADRKRLKDGIEANLILQDKTKLTCLVRFDTQNQCLLLSCDTKVRAIAMTDIKAILHTYDHLKRVESSAGITDVDRCAAIHLSKSGNCIPLFFSDSQDKLIFVDVVEGQKKIVDEQRAAAAAAGGGAGQVAAAK